MGIKTSSRRYVGLELAGAKNQKTALAALEFYPKEKKVFLIDIFEKISTDQALLELLSELRPGIAKLGVNVPLELPPCISCTRKTCPLPTHCRVPEIKWMREQTRKVHSPLEFTPYTQRPVELWVRYQVLPKLPEHHRFEIDETLGGNKAPLTARMHFLRRQLQDLSIIEAWPKLSVAILSMELGLSKRIVSTYRKLEEGAHAREVILEKLAEAHGLFIYERDVRKLAHSLAAFDAFICAYTALLSDSERCTKAPSKFPLNTGWVQYPLLESSC